MRPVLLTFDIFGTVLDWRSGLRESLKRRGFSLDDPSFDRVIDTQASAEAGPFRPYHAIVASSLTETLGVDPATAEAIGLEAGTWPFYPDSIPALGRLVRRAPCAAVTNSDRHHGAGVQERLGFQLTAWICSEEVGAYKPDPRLWRAASERLGVRPGPAWWHVSAYADYDLATARSLGLTCVYVARPHARPGQASICVTDLHELDRLVASAPP